MDFIYTIELRRLQFRNLKPGVELWGVRGGGGDANIDLLDRSGGFIRKVVNGSIWECQLC